MRLSSLARPVNARGRVVIDSTTLAVRKHPRIHSREAGAGLAHRRAIATGWLVGITLHLMVTNRGEVFHRMRAPGTVDDRKSVPMMVCRRFGNRFGDTGSRSTTLCDALLRAFTVALVTGVWSPVNHVHMPLMDTPALRNRVMVETIPNSRPSHARAVVPPQPDHLPGQRAPRVD